MLTVERYLVLYIPLTHKRSLSEFRCSSHKLVTYVTWITDIWPSDVESSNGGFCSRGSFLVKGWATIVCSSVCVGGGAAFFTFASVLPWGHAWRHACVFVTGLKRQTRMRTSWNVPSFIGRTRTCAQLRSERTEDTRTYCGRVERSVNEVVVMGTK